MYSSGRLGMRFLVLVVCGEHEKCSSDICIHIAICCVFDMLKFLFIEVYLSVRIKFVCRCVNQRMQLPCYFG